MLFLPPHPPSLPGRAARWAIASDIHTAPGRTSRSDTGFRAGPASRQGQTRLSDSPLGQTPVPPVLQHWEGSGVHLLSSLKSFWGFIARKEGGKSLHFAAEASKEHTWVHDLAHPLQGAAQKPTCLWLREVTTTHPSSLALGKKKEKQHKIGAMWRSAAELQLPSVPITYLN